MLDTKKTSPLIRIPIGYVTSFQNDEEKFFAFGSLSSASCLRILVSAILRAASSTGIAPRPCILAVATGKNEIAHSDLDRFSGTLAEFTEAASADVEISFGMPRVVDVFGDKITEDIFVGVVECDGNVNIFAASTKDLVTQFVGNAVKDILNISGISDDDAIKLFTSELDNYVNISKVGMSFDLEASLNIASLAPESSQARQKKDIELSVP